MRKLILITLATGSAICIALGSFYLYRKKRHLFWKNQGISGPSPHWLYGNMHQLQVPNRHQVMEEWFKTYGEFYGYYEGPDAILVTSNLEAIERICVKQFSDFQGHNLIPIQPGPEEVENEMFHILFAHGEHWKRLRTSINPAFSTGKLKSYSSLLQKSEQELMHFFRESAKNGEAINVAAAFQLFAFDVIGEVAFGIDLKAIETKGKGSPLLIQLLDLFKLQNMPNPVLDTLRVIPTLIPLTKWLLNFCSKHELGMFKVIGNILNMSIEVSENRRKDPSTRRNDLLQMMIDSPTLSQKEVTAMSFVLLQAGVETTSNTITFCAYSLAKHPEIQEKLREEIYEHFPKQVETGVVVDYDILMNKMEYLDWVCKETLRLYPVGFGIVHRFVCNDTNLCGIHLENGKCHSVLVDMWTVHHDSKLWGPRDPYEFDPERFAPEQSSGRPELAFLPFGYGPRQCVGMRLALFEIKLTITNLLRNFKLELPENELDIFSRENLLIINPMEGKVPLKMKEI